MKLLHAAATRLVEDRVQEGAYLGIVQFSTEARILRYLTKVDNVTRIQLSQSLPAKDDGGRTAIGKGLQEAINVSFYLPFFLEMLYKTVKIYSTSFLIPHVASLFFLLSYTFFIVVMVIH